MDDSTVKRKRMSSGTSALEAKEITQNLYRYGETILNCNVHIVKGIRESGNEFVLKYVCALLNSGGGILHMRNLDHVQIGVQPKHLDTWWSGMENKFADILSCDDICNYFDMVGNYSDPDLYLFVKSAEHLCSLDYHCRLPTDTATHEVTYHSVMKLLQQKGAPCTISDLPQIPENFQYARTDSKIKQETKQIQFKYLSEGSKDSKPIPQKIKQMVSKYISAFANHEGGHILFGIDDVRASAMGELLSEDDQDRTVELINHRMENVIWGDEEFIPEQGKHWDICFKPVIGSPKKKARRVIVVVSVCKFPGGVFTASPDSYFVNEFGDIETWKFSEWKLSMLNPLRDKPDLHNRFIKLPISVPQSPLIFTLRQSIEKIEKRLLSDASKNLVLPHHYMDCIKDLKVKDFIRSVLSIFNIDRHMMIVVNCWGLQVTALQPSDAICDVLVLTENQGCHLVTISQTSSEKIWEHCRYVAAFIKEKLVCHGGCIEKFGLVCHVANMDGYNDEIENSLWENFYPSHFYVTPSKFDSLVQSLIITMAAYEPIDFSTLNTTKSMREVLATDKYFFLLTCDQFDLICKQQFTKELWVHGPPGSGKTVAAVQFIAELRRRGCQKDEVLYLAENELLCSYVRSFNFCLVTTRRKMLELYFDLKKFYETYHNVKNMIVDEAQNFKDRDGDWYGLASHLVSRHETSQGMENCCGYFWVFMDYSQKVHKFKAGLPSVIGKNNYMLSEVARNSKEIFDFAKQFLDTDETSDDQEETAALKKVDSQPHLAHEYSSGREVEIIKCKQDNIEKAISKVLNQLMENGTEIGDVAILVGKSKDKQEIEHAVQDIQKEAQMKEGVLVDTVHRFSGLDKLAVIGVNPHVNEEHASLQKFLLSLATRAKDNLVIITTSDDLKLSETFKSKP
ncbi:unnamed protein product [Mytilus coruscus]|uniref:Schlafen AlbA-2 domain-containing protein n=1 Tax=Mytilus coruscus TaxID=42192 RepID=A0A6J8BAY4_MYTCO|nr:unnamed protein product [Mytilus coruscus]